MALAPEHLSCYGLILEEGTPLFRQVEAGQHLLRGIKSRFTAFTGVQQGFGHQIQGTHTRDDAEELADIADAFPAHTADGACGGRGHIRLAAVTADDHLPGTGQIIAVQRLEQGRFTGPGRPVQGHAFPGAHVKIDVLQRLDADAALLVQDKGFAQMAHLHHGDVASRMVERMHVNAPCQHCRMEVTSNWE